MLSEWKNWCRLCGNTDKTNIDLSIKDENFYELLDTIQNLLSITITNVENPKICRICRQLLINFVQFQQKAKKINKMFTELHIVEGTNEEYKLNLNNLRNKYDLNSITQILIEPIVQAAIEEEEKEEEKYLSNKIENLIDIATGQIPKDDILFINVDVFNPDNIKKENILEEQINNVNDKDQQHKRSIENLSSTKKSITCEICLKKFIRQSNLTTHLKCAHSIENKKKSLPCEICGRTFTTQQKLTAHSRTHIPIEERAIHQCPHCEQKLICEAGLKQHIRSKHIGEKSFICDQCGKTFSTKQEMKVHKYVHDTDNEFQCKKCTKIFKNELRLKVHMKVHRDKMYPCSICGLQLKTPKTLKNHLIIHTDEMPFSCNYCGATFRRDKNLRAHMIIHTGLKPYECPFCTQSYANRSNCKKHQKHSHPEEFAAMQASGIQQYSKNVPKLSQLQTMLEQMKTEMQFSTNS